MKWRRRLLDVGIAADTDVDLAKRVRITNQIAVTNVAVALLFVPVLYALGARWSCLLVAGVATAYAGVPLLNARRRHVAARVALVACINASITLFALLLGHESKMELVLFGAFCVPFALFQRQDRLHWVLALALPAVLYFAIEVIHRRYELAAVLSLDQQRFLSWLLVTALMVDLITRLKFLHDANADAEARLVVARDAALEGSRAKSMFLANMSHEIRTPLNGVIGMTQLALEADPSPEQRDYLETALTSARSLMHILDDALDLARIEARKLVIESAPFDVRETLAEVLRPLGEQARQQGTSLSWSVSGDVARVLVGDRARLGQILTNLVSNAIKFTPGGEVRIVLEEDDETGGLHASVLDNGVGIPRAQLQRIFDAFTQVDESSTRRFGGAGLGLAICRYLVLLLGGRIWVDSEPGRGSAFHFTLPFPAADATSCPPEASGAAPASFSAGLPLSPGDGAPLRVLVVEDNVVNQRVLVLLLERLGHDVTLAENGRLALELVRAAPFDAVLMDVQMPEMDGFATTRAIREWERSVERRTHIIALTAHAMHGDAQRCLDAGMDGYLAKPVDAAQLAGALRDVAARLGAGPAKTASGAPAEPAAGVALDEE